MKDFGEIKLTTPTLDGKKNFRGCKISPRELNCQGFIVFDFERGLVAGRDKEDYTRRLQDAAMRNMNTELVAKPKEKYVIQLVYHPALLEIWKDHSIFVGTEEEKAKRREEVLEKLGQIIERLKVNGELSKMLHKMWTGDRDLWHTLNEMEKNDALPFFVAIEMDYTGKYPKAFFVPASKFGLRKPTDEEETLLLTELNLI